jgi:hypothetical protein
MKLFSKQICRFGCLLVVLGILGLAATAQAMTRVDRSRSVRIHPGASPHHPYRFQYTQPAYNQHRRGGTPKCKQHGLAICLGPKTQSAFEQNRYENQLRQRKIHPYLRKLHQYQQQPARNF